MQQARAGLGKPSGLSHPQVAASRPLVGMLLLILSLWALSCLDASGKWVMAAGVPLLVLCWVRYVVHLILVTALCFAAQFILTRRVASDDAYTSLIWSGLVGTVCLMAALPFILPPALPALAQLSPLNGLVLISTGLSGALGHLLQIAAYHNASASTLAPFVYLQIVSATTMGWLLWGHFPDALTWLGIAIICASGIVIGMLEWRRAGRRQGQGR